MHLRRSSDILGLQLTISRFLHSRQPGRSQCAKNWPIPSVEICQPKQSFHQTMFWEDFSNQIVPESKLATKVIQALNIKFTFRVSFTFCPSQYILSNVFLYSCWFLIGRRNFSKRSSKRDPAAKSSGSTRLSKLSKSSAVCANLLNSQASFGAGKISRSCSWLRSLQSEALRRTLEVGVGTVSRQMIHLSVYQVFSVEYSLKSGGQ